MNRRQCGESKVKMVCIIMQRGCMARWHGRNLESVEDPEEGKDSVGEMQYKEI